MQKFFRGNDKRFGAVGGLLRWVQFPEPSTTHAPSLHSLPRRSGFRCDGLRRQAHTPHRRELLVAHPARQLAARRTAQLFQRGRWRVAWNLSAGRRPRSGHWRADRRAQPHRRVSGQIRQAGLFPFSRRWRQPVRGPGAPPPARPPGRHHAIGPGPRAASLPNRNKRSPGMPR